MSNSRCISLASYRFEDIFEVFKRCGDITPEELLKIKPLAWQDSCRLGVQTNGAREVHVCPPDYWVSWSLQPTVTF